MKIVSISDTHCKHDMIEMPEADMVIHSGDFCVNGNITEILLFSKWFANLPYKYKVCIAGNHDVLFEEQPSLAISLLQEAGDIIYLQDDFIDIQGIKIYGSPWTPMFCNWAFMLERGEDIRARWSAIPEGLDILITHGPPLGIGDWVESEKGFVGCKDLAEIVREKKPRYHIFGHIHDGYGTTSDECTTYINAATCNKKYFPSNPPIVFEI